MGRPAVVPGEDVLGPGDVEGGGGLGHFGGPGGDLVGGDFHGGLDVEIGGTGHEALAVVVEDDVELGGLDVGGQDEVALEELDLGGVVGEGGAAGVGGHVPRAGAE